MARVTVWVPDELLDAAEAASPGLNKSAAFQRGLRDLIGCEHDELTCSTCGELLSVDAIAGPRLAAMFASITNRFRDRVSEPGYEGAARIVRQVAADHGVPGVLATSVPRPSRAQREARNVAALDPAVGARRRHPSNHQPPQEATA